MSAQKEYGYATQKGAPGAFYDNAPREVVSRRNEDEDGKLKYGLGAVIGTSKGNQVKLPTEGKTADDFEGVIVDGYTDEMDRDGKVVLRKDCTVGVLRHGNIWVRTTSEANPAYGDQVYLEVKGDNAGCFTNITGETNVKLDKVKFIGSKGTGDTAPIAI